MVQGRFPRLGVRARDQSERGASSVQAQLGSVKDQLDRLDEPLSPKGGSAGFAASDGLWK